MSRERIMLTQAIPAVQQLRKVQGFDPLRFLKRNANGGIELEPRYQRLWFRLACPDGKMLLNRLRVTDQIAVYEAQVFLSREDNQPITNFTAAVEKAQAPAGRYVQAAQDEALKTALDNAGFGIQLCEINPSAVVDAQADGKQEVATGAVNRQETAPAVRTTVPQRETSVGENHPVQAVPTPQEVQPQEAAKTPSANQQVVPPAQQAESVSDAMSLLQALSGGTAASEPDPVMPQKAQEVPSETAEPAVTERAETAQTVKPIVVDMPAAASTAAAPKYSDDMTVDEILSLMTEEEAAELVVTTGVNKGWTMAQVSEQRPSSLKYYAYSIVVPSGVRDIMREGDALSHCVGKSDRYWERIEQQEAYILFLRKTAEIDKPYYTLEVEPNGTIRQKRTYFDRQNDDLKDAEQFLKEWQKVVSERLTESDREKAEKSKVLRLQEFEQLRQDDIRIHTGDLAGQRLVDVLVSDLMETAA